MVYNIGYITFVSGVDMTKRKKAESRSDGAEISSEDGEGLSRKPGKKKLMILLLLALAVYIVVMAAVVVIVDARHVRFYLSGAREQTLEYGEQYTEPGVYAVTTGRLFGEGTRRLPIETSGTVDLTKLGSYELEYTANFAFGSYTTTRRITIVDTTPPTIELKTVDGYEASWMTGYEEEGYTASDNYDGDITSRVERREEEGRIVYTVSDSSGNRASVERSLSSMDAPPTITLKGESDMTISARMSFEDPGFLALDGQGTDVSELVTVTGGVTPYIAGVYTLTYSLVNSLGEEVTATRTVNVIPVNNPDTVDPEGKTIYLTFDDGPGPYTSRLLDILANYNVRATFFVTAAMEKHYDEIGRAYREGHSIGVHTYSHNYSNIYSSEDAFFQDFNSMQEIIMAQTGSYAEICRFPGGSSNTVSRFNPGIMSRLAQALTDLGYCYFDWNVSSGDAGDTSDTSQIIANIEEGCAQHNYSVVLQHDIKDYSVSAVEQVIIWGLQNGYTFRALDRSSPAVRHGIAN